MKGFTTLDLGGKKRGVKFGNRALLDFATKYNITNGEQLVFSFDVVGNLIYFGLLNNCMITRETPDFSIEDVFIWLDDVSIEVLMSVFVLFTESYSTGQSKGKTTKN